MRAGWSLWVSAPMAATSCWCLPPPAPGARCGKPQPRTASRCNLVSAFRSVEFQAALIRAKLARGQSIDAVLKVNAPPGYSEHHSGRAVDIGEAGCPALEDAFDQTAAFAWLVGHAAAFGFTMSYPLKRTSEKSRADGCEGNGLALASRKSWQVSSPALRAASSSSPISDRNSTASPDRPIASRIAR